MKTFPNGFESWHETHFEVTHHIHETSDLEGSRAYETQKAHGTGGLYDLALELTDKFENMHKGRVWDGDFFDAIQDFLEKEA